MPNSQRTRPLLSQSRNITRRLTILREYTLAVGRSAAERARAARVQYLVSQNQKPFNPDVIPPDFKKAALHRNASGIGNEVHSADSPPQFCECCAR